MLQPAILNGQIFFASISENDSYSNKSLLPAIGWTCTVRKRMQHTLFDRQVGFLKRSFSIDSGLRRRLLSLNSGYGILERLELGH